MKKQQVVLERLLLHVEKHHCNRVEHLCCNTVLLANKIGTWNFIHNYQCVIR